VGLLELWAICEWADLLPVFWSGTDRVSPFSTPGQRQQWIYCLGSDDSEFESISVRSKLTYDFIVVSMSAVRVTIHNPAIKYLVGHDIFHPWLSAWLGHTISNIFSVWLGLQSSPVSRIGLLCTRWGEYWYIYAVRTQSEDLFTLACKDLYTIQVRQVSLLNHIA